ncbi:sugar phosphate isomerase/epimerase family protein [Paenarthrobacter aurescens]|uniref:AP endonuclease n=1 Tax=Paenarthrobacter aurescens TaxID=43663 RepID=A0A4Y3NP93_PAEAU|nr:TIM barrel protein [Paenarthrobacter aurescens]MDO6142121.1 TIM barrel protein [Paenarthrobacter aurescens]MDO6145927.1 TIM barrel protein [Paenarthrobacter aurescens]MDO6157171.1 TIM barrel protein [Paenarthrobacter aurescens]MDO6161156.1 TIM barrel protein [Paenarthrobacter aurescens]GEB21006.1 AP endonuclease [Paenarthrobacter aurescens]
MGVLSLEQVSGSNFAYQHHTLERCLDDMAQLGRSAVELWGIAPHLHIPQADSAHLRKVRGQLLERGLSASCLTPEQVAYPVNIASGEEWLRDQSLQFFLRAAEVCSELESPLLFLTAGRGYEDQPAEVAWARSVDALRTITQRAAELGVGCVLEPLQRVESNLVTDSGSLRLMLDDVGSSTLGVVIDTVAMAAADEQISHYAKAFGESIRHVHLIDGAPTGHLAWGDGFLDLQEILWELGQLNYSGALTFELFGDGSYSLNPRAAVTQCLNAVHASLARIAS